MSQVRFGADRLAADLRILEGARRVALLTNDAARLAEDAQCLSRTALLEAGVPLVRLFSPEHGISSAAPDGAPVEHGRDAVTGVPVVSLYGAHFQPLPDDLVGLDLVLVDLPDVGARFYTYLWTMTHVLDACAQAGTPVMVLDRPNPLGGRLDDVEGPLLEPSCESFLGRHAIPIRHSLTLGELARLWQRERAPTLSLSVVPCSGWRRAMLWPETHLPFVPTSPAIRSFESSLLYPGMCLFEATNVSVERHGDRPFQALSATWMDGAAVVARLAQDPRSAGVRFTGAAGRIDVSVTAAALVRPVALGVALLEAVVALHRDHLRWMPYPTAANPSGEGHERRLAGTARLRALVDAGERVPDSLLAAHGWSERVSSLLLYS